MAQLCVVLDAYWVSSNPQSRHTGVTWNGVAHRRRPAGAAGNGRCDHTLLPNGDTRSIAMLIHQRVPQTALQSEVITSIQLRGLTILMTIEKSLSDMRTISRRSAVPSLARRERLTGAVACGLRRVAERPLRLMETESPLTSRALL